MATAHTFRGSGRSYPDPFYSINVGLGSLSLDLFHLLSLDCVHKTSYEHQLYIMAATPLGLFVVMIGGQALTVAAFGGSVWNGSATKVCTVLIVIILPTVTTTVCSAFACVMFDGVEYMVVDYRLKCGTPRYASITLFAFVAVFVYVVGVPLLFFVLLWKNRRAIETRKSRSGRPSLGTLAVLFRPYHRQLWWCSTLDMMRRLALSSLLLVIVSPVFQLGVAFVVSASSVILFRELKPFYGTS